MHKTVYILCGLITLSACARDQKKAALQHAQLPAHNVGKNALRYTNEFRATKKLQPLAWSQELADRAYTHAYNMGTNKVSWGHDGFKERVHALSAPIQSAAENIFMSNTRNDVARLAVDSWIGSAGHYKNLIGNYTHCGIGVYKNDQGFWYFTQIFATFQ